MLTFLTLLGVLLFCSNSPSVSLLISLVLSLLGSFSVYLQGGSSLLCVIGLLVFAGGLFVIMSFVVFSSSFDFDIPFWNISVVAPVLFVLFFSQDSTHHGESYSVSPGGEYLASFVFVLLILLFLLFCISSLLDEKSENLSVS